MAVSLLLILTACGGGDSGSGPTDPTDPVPTTVSISVSDLSFASLGLLEQLAVTVWDQRGDQMAATVTWSSSDSQVASVTSGGVVTAEGNGTAMITATATANGGSASDTVEVTVQQVVVMVSFARPTVAVTLGGDPVALQPTGFDLNGYEAPLGATEWSSVDPAVVTVDASGTVTAVSLGWSRVVAAVGEVEGSAAVHVMAPGFPSGTIPAMRAVHLGGNWLGNQLHAGVPHEEWDHFMESINGNWAGVSVALHYGQATDPTVRRVYDGNVIKTFTDEVLRTLIREMRSRGIDVYVTLAFEPDLETEGVPDRTVLGQPFMGGDVDSITVLVAEWPWHPDNPDHQEFVAQFWASYTEQAVHFATIAEEEGAALFSLGTETEQLFRTRTAGPWVTEFGDEIRTMVSEVKSVFSGLVTYDQVYSAYIDTDFWWDLPEKIWADADFDAIGVSAYFRLAEEEPDYVMTVAELQSAWEQTFTDYLVPLTQTYPELPIFFTEFGYTSDIRSPASPTSYELTPRIPIDTNNNGLEDGEEVQANILEALFRTLESYPIVDAIFHWDHAIDADAEIEAESTLRSVRVRGKLAEEIVRLYYGGSS